MSRHRTLVRRVGESHGMTDVVFPAWNWRITVGIPNTLIPPGVWEEPSESPGVFFAFCTINLAAETVNELDPKDWEIKGE